MLIMRVLSEKFVENEHATNSYLQLGPRSQDFINNLIPFYITVGKTKAKKIERRAMEEDEEIEVSEDEWEYDSDNVWQNYDLQKSKQQLNDLDIQEDEENKEEAISNKTENISKKSEETKEYLAKDNWTNNIETEINETQTKIEDYKENVSKSINNPPPNSDGSKGKRKENFSKDDLRFIEK